MDGGRTIQGTDDKLISYIRSELQDQQLTYSTLPILVEGGYDTIIYRFQLEGASGELAEPLILRVFMGSGANRTTFEGLVQEAVAGSGYPAPKVHFTCTDEGVLGAGFLVMELMPGRPMTKVPEDAIPGMLAEAHLHLHGIEADPIRGALESAGIKPWGHSPTSP